MDLKIKDKNQFLKVVPENIPDELKGYNQWVCWKAEVQDGKVKKVPYSPITGSKAKSNDPATWADFERANQSYADGKKYDGIGFVLIKNDPFFSWDLDHLRDQKTGEIKTNKAETIIKRLGSYTEISPSGNGFRIFGKAKLPEGKKKAGNFEVYDRTRYMTVTGAHLKGTPKEIKECQKANDNLYRKIFGTNQKSEKERQSNPKQDTHNIIEKRLQKAFGSKNGIVIERLYNGDIQGYDSQSEADQALCNYLAFWLDKDKELIDQAFRSSGLYRDKWDEPHFADGRTYGEATIQKAIEGVSVTYNDRLNLNETSDSVKSKPLTFTPIKELLATKFDHKAAVIGNGILPEGGGLILAGESDVGKSLITLEWAINLALGYHLLGGKLTVIKPRKVMVFQVENPRPQVQDRLKKMISGINLTDVPDNIVFANENYSYDMRKKWCVEQMIAGIRDHSAEVFVVDPLSSFHSLNENDNSQMRRVLDKLTYISRTTGTAAVIVHHFGKPVQYRDRSYSLRGASSIKDWADTVITLEKKRHEHKELRLLTFEKVRHGKKPKPVLLERDDESLLHNLTEAHTTIPHIQIGPFIQNQFGGHVKKKSTLKEALAQEFDCSPKTAERAIDEAVNMNVIEMKKKGARNEYRVTKG